MIFKNRFSVCSCQLPVANFKFRISDFGFQVSDFGFFCLLIFVFCFFFMVPALSIIASSVASQSLYRSVFHGNKDKNINLCLKFLKVSIIKALLVALSFVVFSSCFDLVECTYWHEGNYFVKDNPADASCKTLYYDLGGNSGLGRINYASKIGSNTTYIIVESINKRKENKQEFWILNKDIDKPELNADEIVQGPFSLAEFNERKNQLKIGNLDFEKEIK